jgi:amidophosphoribosyltransferase
VSSIANYGMVAFRDPHGIRPLSLGRQIHNDGSITHILSSETCIFNTDGFEHVRDLAPGECLIVTLNGELESRICAKNTSLNICIFEFVYLSRPDSVIDGAPVYLARQNMGRKLANTILQSKIEIDVIVSVPDTARLSAIEVANQLQKPYKEGFVKHTFIGRTFMLATQGQRNTAIRNKLNPIKGEFFGKNVLLVDDSIVRGTTSAQIVNIVRNSGAKKVFFAFAAPQIRYPNFYGIDLPTHNELIAYNRTDEEIATLIGADKVIFQTLADLKASISELNPQITNFETSCFDGKYLTNDIKI